MSILKELKSVIDFTLFNIEPPSWEKNTKKWRIDSASKVSNQLILCQEQINSISSGFHNKIDPKSKAKLQELKKRLKKK